jgi:uncharacterized membrane protein (DUF485 family)|tara:strand:+ start:559 stop:846 length:288 start_codon:yes stop_codon:yes gene_type:complete
MQIRNTKEIYQQLKEARIKILIPLILLTITSYFSFIWVIAFNPNFFSILIFDTNISIGIFLGFLLILLIFLITLIYVYFANKILEPLINKIKKNE